MLVTPHSEVNIVLRNVRYNLTCCILRFYAGILSQVTAAIHQELSWLSSGAGGAGGRDVLETTSNMGNTAEQENQDRHQGNHNGKTAEERLYPARSSQTVLYFCLRRMQKTS